MKLKKINSFKYALLGVAGLAFASSANAALVFSTGFNNNTNRDAGTLGSAATTGEGTAVMTYGTDTIGGVSGSYIQLENVANAVFVTGTGLNTDATTYTAVLDVYTPRTGFTSLFGNSTEDVEIFVRPDGRINGNFATAPAGTIAADTWHRVVLSVDGTTQIGTLYVDGNQVGATGDMDYFPAGFGIFGDNSGDNTVGSRAANFALFDTVLTASEVSTLGGANGALISAVPEPSSTALLGLGGLALILRRKK